MPVYHTFSGAAIPCKIVRSVQPLTYGCNAGAPRALIRLLEDAEFYSYKANDILVVLSRFVTAD